MPRVCFSSLLDRIQNPKSYYSMQDSQGGKHYSRGRSQRAQHAVGRKEMSFSLSLPAARKVAANTALYTDTDRQFRIELHRMFQANQSILKHTVASYPRAEYLQAEYPYSRFHPLTVYRHVNSVTKSKAVALVQLHWEGKPATGRE